MPDVALIGVVALVGIVTLIVVRRRNVGVVALIAVWISLVALIPIRVALVALIVFVLHLLIQPLAEVVKAGIRGNGRH